MLGIRTDYKAATAGRCFAADDPLIRTATVGERHIQGIVMVPRCTVRSLTLAVRTRPKSKAQSPKSKAHPVIFSFLLTNPSDKLSF
jgi:hypothetical protein